MPVIDSSDYRPPRWLPGGHAQTVFPAFFRALPRPASERRRISTPDGDFLDLDLSRGLGGFLRKPGLIILSHGLEGHSRRQYILGMSRIFLRRGWDTLAWNQRFCSGEPNLTPRLYHSGETGDLQTVIRYAVSLGYHKIVLAGFSMGGNQILKYLGESAGEIPGQVAGAVAFSVPCHLASCSVALCEPSNRLYMANFMRTLRRKMYEKHLQRPGYLDVSGLDEMKDFREFDGRFTAPAFGFASAEDYWEKAASLPFLSRINLPALLVNALNDPFLPKECYPFDAARASSSLYLETPEEGGHTGFTPADGCPGPDKRVPYWSETRALRFVEEFIGPPDA